MEKDSYVLPPRNQIKASLSLDASNHMILKNLDVRLQL